MIVTVSELGYELRPYAAGTCWELFEWTTNRKNRAGESQPDTWRPMGIYPSDLPHACRIILERSARRSKVAGELREVAAEMQRLYDTIGRACESACLPHSPSSASEAHEVGIGVRA